jgi:hypothetical protein
MGESAKLSMDAQFAIRIPREEITLAMTRSLFTFRLFLMIVILLLQIPLGGCAEHNTYREYDGYSHDHHAWDDREQSHYLEWEKESHRDHRDFRNRSSEEQNEYWQWRQKHGDNSQ